MFGKLAKSFYFTFFVLFAGAIQALGAELQLKDVLSSVDQHYPLIVAAKREIEKMQGDLLSAQGGFDPILKGNAIRSPIGEYTFSYLNASVEQPLPLWGSKIYGGWRSGQGNFPIYEGNLVTSASGEVRGGIEVSLLRNGSIDERRARIQLNEKGLESAKASLALQRLETIRQATYRYWDWVAAGSKLAIAQNLLKIAETRDSALHRRVKHGDAPQIELVENQRAVVQRQASLVSAERALQKATLELSLFFRDSSGTPIYVEKASLPTHFPQEEPKEEIKSIDPLVEIQSVLGRHPELKRLQFQMDQTQIDLRLAKNQILPRLDLQLGASMDLGNSFSLTHSPNYDPPPFTTELKFSVSLEIPLFFRTARGKIGSAQASFLKMETQNVFARDRIQNNITDALQSMEASQKRVALARQELELSRKLEEGERVRFFHGDGTLLIVNIREQTTRDAANREVDALVEYYRAKADYQMALANHTL